MGLLEIGLHVADVALGAGRRELGRTPEASRRQAEVGGIARLTVMDHFWRTGVGGCIDTVSGYAGEAA